MNPLPHDGWAGLYDAVYRRGYGRLYKRITAVTLEQVALAVPPPARVLDCGAGTGRLALPLARAGYSVTAVEPSGPMLEVLQENARREGLPVEILRGRMDGLRAGPVFDLALCVFTVLLYILEEDELGRSFRAVSESLRPGGLFLVDVPRAEMFAGGFVRGDGVKRAMSITPRGGDLFDYAEETSVEVDGRVEHFSEAFTIRYWSPERVLAMLAEAGFEMEKDLTPLLKRSGCDYYLMKKAPDSPPLQGEAG